MSHTPKRAESDAPADEFWLADQHSGATSTFDPLGWFRVVLQYKWPILLITVLVTALAYAYTLTVQPLYRASQSLLLQPTRSNVVAIEEVVQDSPEDGGYVQTQIEMLQSREHARRVIDSLGLLSDPIFMGGLADAIGVSIEQVLPGAVPSNARPVSDGTADDTPGATDGEATSDADSRKIAAPVPMLPRNEIRLQATTFFLSRLTISNVATTRLVRASFVSPDPEQAAAVANEVGLQYIMAYVEANRSRLDEVSGWLGNRLDELKNKLDASQQQRLEFKRDNGLINVEGSIGRLSEQELLQRSEELANARIELSNLDSVLIDLEQASGTDELLALLPELRNDQVLRQTRTDINRTRQEIERLSNQYGPRHPRIVDLRSELQSLQSTFGETVRQARESVENQHSLLERRVASLSSRLASGKQAVQGVDELRGQLDALDTEVETNRELYFRFFSRMIETQSTQGLESVNASIVEYATPSLLPDTPDTPFVLALAAIGALGFSTLGVMVVHGLDDSITRVTDVKNKTGERLLGIIPLYRPQGSRMGTFLSFGKASRERANRVFVEAFRTARTNLMVGRGRAAHRIVLVASSVPGEGKSMCSVCLARSFAQVERVLLIDADIRRPSLHRALKLDADQPGLTSAIIGHANIRDCIQHNSDSGYDILPSGPATDQPLELLSSAKFEDLLGELALLYDRIIIDSAPVEAVSDTLVLSRLVDAVVYVAKANDTSIKVINNGLDKLRSVEAPLAGVLLSQVDLNKLAAYGADYQYHGYYDYYDYSAPAHRQSLNLEREDLRRINAREAPRTGDDSGAATADKRPSTVA